jgi:hypothetical protein
MLIVAPIRDLAVDDVADRTNVINPVQQNQWLE